MAKPCTPNMFCYFKQQDQTPKTQIYSLKNHNSSHLRTTAQSIRVATLDTKEIQARVITPKICSCKVGKPRKSKTSQPECLSNIS